MDWQTWCNNAREACSDQDVDAMTESLEIYDDNSHNIPSDLQTKCYWIAVDLKRFIETLSN